MNDVAVYSYSPGRALAICGPKLAALVDLPPDAGLVSGLFELIGGASAGLDEVLELLVSPGLRAVENFALAEHTDEGLRTVVRGRYRIQAGTQLIEGRGLWTDRIVDADGYLMVDPAVSDLAALSLTGGVVLAGRLERRPRTAPLPPTWAPYPATTTTGPEPGGPAFISPDAPSPSAPSASALSASGRGAGSAAEAASTASDAATQVELARPALGVLRLSNGDTVVLDRNCVLGRNPRVPAGYSGEQPNLVKLIDPGKDISGQHLEVSVDDWRVSVKDLGSTNGTQITVPGKRPVKLRPNEPMPIVPGTTVVLAGVFSFVFDLTP
ncbi:MAG: FHA domain-containing protein [Micropruina sp.]|uniref:FHA domain-containing protein n=1 Tax=Micropruina sp. TaxID=2737536 RepID=UPI0039E645DF